MNDSELIRIGALAARSGVPAPTIKHYLREGLLPGPAKRTARNMAYYDARLVERVRAIKQLQKEHFLPLDVIKGLLDGSRAIHDRVTAQAIAQVLARARGGESRTRAQLIRAGVRGVDLEWLKAARLLSPEGKGEAERYSGDDLELLRILGEARRKGIRPEMLPTDILQAYVQSIRELVRAELGMFRAGVVPRAGGDLAQLTEAATVLSERLVVLIRRRLLLPVLDELVRAESPGQKPRVRAKRRARKVSP